MNTTSTTATIHSPVRVMVADDDPQIRRLLARKLESCGYEPVLAADGVEALARWAPDIPIAVLDLSMPETDGLECLRQVRSRTPDSKAIIISATQDPQRCDEARNSEAYAFVQKPIDVSEVIDKIEEALRESDDWATDRTRYAQTDNDVNWIASSPGMRTIAQRMNRIASSQSTVLIMGESGVGKTLIAQQIHQLGRRRDRPFVSVNCASLPRELIESELFGHTSGAFTGALRNRMGRVEAADGGTLFLDEVGDLPIELQPKLLTLVQDQTFQRLGSDALHQSDVRIIAATNQNLLELRERKLFRDDLFYRLNVLALRVPPLRERLDEIPALAEESIRRRCREVGRARQLDATAIARLQEHDWPGNVRELENVLERSMVFSDHELISADDLVFDDSPLAAPPDKRPTQQALLTLEELESTAIDAALQRSGGNRAQAAKQLGISERSIYNKIKRYGLHDDA